MDTLCVCVHIIKDPTRFCEGYNDLISFMEEDSNWQIAKQELTARKARYRRPA